MKKVIWVNISFLFIYSFSLFGQQNVEGWVQQGVTLHDEGKYNQAISAFHKAIFLDSASSIAHHEISLSYTALQQFDSALVHSSQVLALGNDLLLPAYLVKGKSLESLGNEEEARILYEEAVEKFPTEYLLHFNLTLAFYKEREFTKAQKHAEISIGLNSGHASSHLILGYVLKESEKTIQSLLSLYYFLLIEPNSGRSAGAYELLRTQQKSRIKNKDDFTENKALIELFDASQSLEDIQGKTQMELFVEQTQSFFRLLGEENLPQKRGLWWDFYISFFADLNRSSHTDTFCYYISQNQEKKEVNSWLDQNPRKRNAFETWVNQYDFTSTPNDSNSKKKKKKN